MERHHVIEAAIVAYTSVLVREFNGTYSASDLTPMAIRAIMAVING